MTTLPVRASAAAGTRDRAPSSGRRSDTELRILAPPSAADVDGRTVQAGRVLAPEDRRLDLHARQLAALRRELDEIGEDD